MSSPRLIELPITSRPPTYQTISPPRLKTIDMAAEYHAFAFSTHRRQSRSCSLVLENRSYSRSSWEKAFTTRIPVSIPLKTVICLEDASQRR